MPSGEVAVYAENLPRDEVVPFLTMVVQGLVFGAGVWATDLHHEDDCPAITSGDGLSGCSCDFVNLKMTLREGQTDA